MKDRSKHPVGTWKHQGGGPKPVCRRREGFLEKVLCLEPSPYSLTWANSYSFFKSQLKMASQRGLPHPLPHSHITSLLSLCYTHVYSKTHYKWTNGTQKLNFINYKVISFIMKLMKWRGWAYVVCWLELQESGLWSKPSLVSAGVGGSCWYFTSPAWIY